MGDRRRAWLLLAPALALAACAGSRESRREPPREAPAQPAAEAAPADPAQPPPAAAEATEPRDAPPEEPRPAPRGAPGERPARDPDAALREARASVAALAHRSWAEARVSAASALDALADAAPGAPEEALRTIRTSARELRDRDDIGFEHTERVQRGLDAALAALTASAGSRALDPWIRAAREAVAALRPGVPFDLHRAPIQDAFRAVVDAFLAGALQRSPAVSAREP